jgi:osmotically-inducible protein OsmY
MSTITRKPTLLTLAAALAGALALGGCNNRQDDQSNAADRAVAQTEQKSQELKEDAAKGMDKARAATREMAQDAKQAGQNVGDKVSDAVITTTVNAEIAKDSSLSALKVNVDTTDGKVVLHGSAPNEAARERATTLASNVKGVVSVDNQLTLRSEG